MYAVDSQFASADECDHIVALYDTLRGHPHMRYPGGTRTEIEARVLADDPILTEVRHQAMRHLWRYQNRDLVPEFTLLAEMQPGDTVPVHADNVVCAADQWVPNHTGFRAATALVYLTDFTGGAIVHTHVGTTLSAPKGGLVSFPCDGHYEHRVDPVTSGRRLALAVWAAYPPHPTEPWPSGATLTVPAT